MKVHSFYLNGHTKGISFTNLDCSVIRKSFALYKPQMFLQRDKNRNLRNEWNCNFARVLYAKSNSLSLIFLKLSFKKVLVLINTNPVQKYR